jgi:hypothetical protein
MGVKILHVMESFGQDMITKARVRHRSRPMRFPQLIVYESDGRLAALLRDLASTSRWSFREARQTDECLRLLTGPTAPAVLVVRIGRDLEKEMALIEEIGFGYPGVSAVVVGDAEHGRLVGMAWDLGAAYVHVPPTPRENLVAVVAGLMNVAFLEEAE